LPQNAFYSNVALALAAGTYSVNRPGPGKAALVTPAEPGVARVNCPDTGGVVTIEPEAGSIAARLYPSH
jgi:hypothetical protein